MCERCFADEGRPVEMPETAPQCLELMARLYEQWPETVERQSVKVLEELPEDERANLYRMLEHFDVEDEYLRAFTDKDRYPAEAKEVMNELLAYFRGMPRWHRAAVVGYFLDYFDDPALCPYSGCGKAERITHEILMWPQSEEQNWNPAQASAQRVLACAVDTERIALYQRSPKVDRNVLVFTYDVGGRRRLADVTHQYLTQTG